MISGVTKTRQQVRREMRVKDLTPAELARRRLKAKRLHAAALKKQQERAENAE